MIHFWIYGISREEIDFSVHMIFKVLCVLSNIEEKREVLITKAAI
jgi:hypothetical protein